MRMLIGLDAQPLRPPLTGVGKYVYELLDKLPLEGIEWILYSSVDPVLPENFAAHAKYRVRTFEGAPWALRLQTQVVLAAKQDRVDVFWAPNAVAPLVL